MARKMPVMSCMVKHMPRIEPKFHQIERLIGAGRSRKLVFTIEMSGLVIFRELGIGRG